MFLLGSLAVTENVKVLINVNTLPYIQKLYKFRDG